MHKYLHLRVCVPHNFPSQGNGMVSMQVTPLLPSVTTQRRYVVAQSSSRPHLPRTVKAHDSCSYYLCWVHAYGSSCEHCRTTVRRATRLCGWWEVRWRPTRPTRLQRTPLPDLPTASHPRRCLCHCMLHNDSLSVICPIANLIGSCFHCAG